MIKQMKGQNLEDYEKNARRLIAGSTFIISGVMFR
jgi:hypothetical protein